MPTESVKFFKELSKHDVGEAGGKGASLGEMTRAGIPVPPGFVVTASAFERFLEETDLNVEIDAALAKVRHQEMESVERASEKIQAMILAAAFPKDLKVEIVSSFKKLKAKYVAVRSSATSEDSAEAAWAGQLDSYLNTTDKQLLKNVQRCWASLFTPRAIFYRFEKGLHKTKISVAVVVQKMVQSESSGIAFSVHPVTEDYNQLIVEAGFGLGEAIVSGQVTPDSYVVDKKAGAILDTNVSTQDRMLTKVPAGGNKWVNIPANKASSQVLTNKEVLQMAAIVQNIEKHYGFPVDVEWAREGKNFYVVQSRPITTLKKLAAVVKPAAKAKPATKPLKKNLKNSSDGVHFSSGFRQLSVTRTCSLWHDLQLMVGNATCSAQYGLKTWANMSSVVRDGVLTSHFSEESSLTSYSQDVLSLAATKSKRELLKKRYEKFGSALLISVSRVASAPTEKNLLVFYRDYQRLATGLFFTAILGRAGTTSLQARLAELGYPQHEIAHMVAVLSYPHTHTPLFESQLALLSIGVQAQQKKLSIKKIEELLTSWVTKFGVIPVNFCGTPWSVSDAWAQLKSVTARDAAAQLRTANGEHSQRLTERSKLLKKIADVTVTELSDALALCTTLNEYQKNIFCRTSLAYRPLFVHVASLAGSFDWKDCFYMTPDEMLSVIRGERVVLKKIVAARRIAGYEHGEQKVVRPMSAADVRLAVAYVSKTNGSAVRGPRAETSVSGFAAGSGTATGTARIVLSDRDFHKVKRGDILVAPMTSVDYVPVMELAAAFVTNEGGVTSHASIVAREMGKPCVIGTKNATQVLKDGDRVTVDGQAGAVTILGKQKR